MNKKNDLKLWVKILIVVVIVFCYMTSIFLTFLFVNDENNNEPIYSYNINQNLNYKVNLFDNSFIDSEALSSNQMYISELIKNIEVRFLFDYSATKSSNLNYEYEIVATLNGTYQGTEEKKSVWSKKYQLSELIKENISSSNFLIDKNIYIDFPTYKNEVEAFKREFGMSLTTTLDIEFITSINGKIDNEKIEKKSTILLSIPLGVQAFSITDDYQKNISDNILVDNNKKLWFSKLEFIIILLLIGIILTIIFFNKIFVLKEKNNYNKKLEKILKNYGDVIVQIASPINIEDYEIIEVKGIEEMVGLEEELRIPINFYEHIPNHYGEFTLIHNNILYRYIIEEK